MYRNPTTTDIITPFDPFHSLLHELLNAPVSPNDYKNELKIIK